MSFKKILIIFALVFTMQQSTYAKIQWFEKKAKPSDVDIVGLIHVENIGDVPFQNKEWLPASHQNLRVEAMALQLKTNPKFLNLQYMCHLENSGDSAWMSGGELCGTRGESRRLEGFALRLTGEYARYYSIKYQCRNELGKSKVKADGKFCGTRGEYLALEGIKIWIVDRDTK